ncbi:hypothetical protein [Tannerella forsythia]|uniref:Uncharacterized protein n=1 Tax=Tannerella forsythia TaxID=28112 RepID=A0A2A6E5J6_TANFO|nr:hypothetical protein [Tannerella forsythia]KKY60362.1 hypothetical protein Tanf_13260 [Tannerella forsythia]PDP42784.1 hypothetical protein CLI86_11800 [Tannerella forsythia]PDP70172.1 hypothetical protein CLI85_10485 [Tannerella forsythia]TPE15170.1 hypothetical protein FJN16_10965 [Tannerella forsythia]
MYGLDFRKKTVCSALRRRQKAGRAAYYQTRRMNCKEQSGATIAPADTILNEQLPFRYARLQ